MRHPATNTNQVNLQADPALHGQHSTQPWKANNFSPALTWVGMDTEGGQANEQTQGEEKETAEGVDQGPGERSPIATRSPGWLMHRRT